MPTIDIHGKQVHVEEGSQSAHFAAEYLKNNPENAEAFFDEAHLHYKAGGGFTHFVVPKTNSYKDVGVVHHMSLLHNLDGSYTLKKRDGY